jgi:hypothetical protein
MVYCRECGELVEESDKYCLKCGSALDNSSDGYSDEEWEEVFWKPIEKLIGAKVDNVSNMDSEVLPYQVDKFALAWEMFITGSVTGEIRGMIHVALSRDGVDLEDIDTTSISDRIVDIVRERRELIKENLEENVEKPAA